MRRSELKAGYTSDAFSVSARYAFIQAQPLYGFDEDRREVSLGGSARLHENWRVFGSGTYDFEQNVMVRDAVGFAYDDECFTYLMTFAETRDRNTEEVTQSIGFNLSFRTLGDFGIGSSDTDALGPICEARPADILSPYSEGMERLRQQQKIEDRKPNEMFSMRKCLTSAGLALMIAASPASVAFLSMPAAASEIKVIVNRIPITTYDIQRRAAFMKLQRRKGNLNEQAEEELIDQSLRLAEAQRLGIRITDEQVDTSYNHFAKSNKMQIKQLDGIMAQSGVTKAHFKEFIRSQMAWNQARRHARPQRAPAP